MLLLIETLNWDKSISYVAGCEHNYLGSILRKARCFSPQSPLTQWLCGHPSIHSKGSAVVGKKKIGGTHQIRENVNGYFPKRQRYLYLIAISSNLCHKVVPSDYSASYNQ
jgi:hypothetical protein